MDALPAPQSESEDDISDIDHLAFSPPGDLNLFASGGVAQFDVVRKREVQDYYFVLLPKLTMLAFSSAVEPLRMANKLSGHLLYRWHLLSEDGQPVTCSNGITIEVGGSVAGTSLHGAVVICSGLDGFQAARPATLAMLRNHNRRGGRVGGICTGAYTLARAGLLTGRKFTLHWNNQHVFAELFPDLNISQRIFENDTRIFTCGGGSAVTDMMLAIIEGDHGPELSGLVGDMCLHGLRRRENVTQKRSFAASVSTRNPQLVEIVKKMHDNMEEPLTFEELSDSGNVSKRQMERLFKKYLGVSPARYYKNIRLNLGRSLLRETDLPVIEISAACGFRSSVTFSRSFKARFGQNPSMIVY